MWLWGLFTFEKIKRKKVFFKVSESAVFRCMKNLHTKKTSSGSNLGWLIQQITINQKSRQQTFRRRFVSGSLFVLPCPPECYLQSETKIEPDFSLTRTWIEMIIFRWSMKRLLLALGQLRGSETSFLTIYRALVQPHCRAVWGNCKKGLSQKLQKLSKEPRCSYNYTGRKIKYP